MTATLELFRHADDTIAFRAGEPLFRQGELAKLMFVLIEGEVEIRVGDRVVETSGPGAILGEMALIDDEPRSASAIATADCRVVAIDEKRFRFLVQQTPHFATQVMKAMADRLRSMNARVLAS